MRQTLISYVTWKGDWTRDWCLSANMLWQCEYKRCSWHFGFGCICMWLTCCSKNVITGTRCYLTVLSPSLPAVLFICFEYSRRFYTACGLEQDMSRFCQVLCCPEHKRCLESIVACGLWQDWNSLKIHEFELRGNCRYSLIMPFYNWSESYIKCWAAP